MCLPYRDVHPIESQLKGARLYSVGVHLIEVPFKRELTIVVTINTTNSQCPIHCYSDGDFCTGYQLITRRYQNQSSALRTTLHCMNKRKGTSETTHGIV